MARINKIILPAINKMLISTHGPQVKRFWLCVIATRVSRPHMLALRLIIAVGIFWVLMPWRRQGWLPHQNTTKPREVDNLSIFGIRCLSLRLVEIFLKSNQWALYYLVIRMQRSEIVHTLHIEPIVPGWPLFHLHASVPRSHHWAVVLLDGREHGGRAWPLHLSLTS